mmetsp:Transcript_35872/g.78539  ORF Transcript_35872/g.78539 Transcript_35872/m.78539 type:complete len:208 (+) Transcript_35872:605-1228(+)
MLLSPLLHLLPHLSLDLRRIGDGLVSEDSHQVGHLNFGRRGLKDAHLNLVPDLLCSLLALESSKLFSLLRSQMHHRGIVNLLLSAGLDGYGVLHVGRDFLDVHLGILPLQPEGILAQKGRVPPLDLRDGFPPHNLRLDLPHAHVSLLGVLVVLLFSLLLFLLLLGLLFLLVHTQRLLLEFLDQPLLLLHQGALLHEPESPSPGPLRA